MAASFGRVSIAVVLLVLCFGIMCKTVAAGPQHTCTYPQACTNPGPPDPTHMVTVTAQYNAATKKCDSFPAVTVPHSCLTFGTLEDCKESCESA